MGGSCGKDAKPAPQKSAALSVNSTVSYAVEMATPENKWESAVIVEHTKAKVLRLDHLLTDDDLAQLAKAMWYKAASNVEAERRPDTTDCTAGYTAVFGSCNRNSASVQKFYKLVSTIWDDYLTNTVMPAIAAQPAEFNRRLGQVFEMVNVTNSIFLYPNRSYTREHNLPHTTEVAIAKIRDAFSAFKPAPAGADPNLWLMFCVFDADGDARFVCFVLANWYDR